MMRTVGVGVVLLTLSSRLAYAQNAPAEAAVNGSSSFAAAAAPVVADGAAASTASYRALATLVQESSDKAAEKAKANAQENAKATKAAVDEAEVETATRQFAGLKFGIGIGLTFAGENSRLEEAVVVPSTGTQPAVVRATTRKNASARVFLESHYFFEFAARKGGSKLFGAGPFIALQPGTDEIINALGFGVMIGARRSATTSASFNLGIGIVIEPAVRTLGDGVEANKPLPEGETTVRYQQKSLVSGLAIASFSF